MILSRLREMGPSLFTFLTFILSALFRFLHQLAFSVRAPSHPGLTFLNLLLADVCLTAALLGGDDGPISALSASLFIQWEHARRNQPLAEDLDPQLDKRLSFLFMTEPLGSAGASAVTLIQPILALLVSSEPLPLLRPLRASFHAQSNEVTATSIAT